MPTAHFSIKSQNQEGDAPGEGPINSILTYAELKDAPDVRVTH